MWQPFLLELSHEEMCLCTAEKVALHKIIHYCIKLLLEYSRGNIRPILRILPGKQLTLNLRPLWIASNCYEIVWFMKFPTDGHCIEELHMVPSRASHK